MQIKMLLGKIIQEQEEQKKQLEGLRNEGESKSVGGALLEAVQVRGNRKIEIENGSVSLEEAQQALHVGLERAAMVAACAVEEETQRRRVKAFQEFANWLVPNQKALGKTGDPYGATPEELVAYHHNYWILHHGETELKGRVWPAPGSLEANFSLLSGVFESAGRSGMYNGQLRIGNPVLSKLVRDYKEGYARLLRDIGYASTSAVHMKEEKLVKVIILEEERLQTRRQQLNWLDRRAVIQYLIKERDIVVLCGLWQCTMRGKDMGVLEKERVQDRDGVSLYPSIIERDIIGGLEYQIAPKGTKKVQRNRAGVIRLEAEVEERRVLCLLRRLQQHARSCAAAGVTDSEFILRPETSNHLDLKNDGLSSSVMNKRMQKLLDEYGEWKGETLHGIRRGTMQHDAAMGKIVEEIGAKALQVTREVTIAYLDTSRETYGSKRVKRQ